MAYLCTIAYFNNVTSCVSPKKHGCLDLDIIEEDIGIYRGPGKNKVEQALTNLSSRRLSALLLPKGGFAFYIDSAGALRKQ